MQDAYSKARNYCYRLLKYRLRSINEIRQRLNLKKYAPDIIEKTILFLTESDLLDDHKFCRAWVNSRRKIKYLSRNMLRQELKAKGVDLDTVNAAVALVTDEEELNLAKALAKKAYAKIKNLKDINCKNKFFTYLKRRGYSSALINEIMQELMNGNDN